MPEILVIPAEFLDVFRDLVRAYQPRGLDRDTPRVYWETMRIFPIAVLRESAIELRQRSSAFFPSTTEWFQVASAHGVKHGRSAPTTCAQCRDAGLVRINYRSGEPSDIAICTCRAGQFFRDTGEDAVRNNLHLAAEHRVAYLEDFDEEGAA
jgi:hypothetical protein